MGALSGARKGRDVSNLVAVLKKGRRVITGMLADLIGPDSLIVIAVIVIVLFFGGSRLPKLARGLGSASHEFKKGMEEGDPEKGQSSAQDDDKTTGLSN